jgi:hypothetical protein
VISEEAGKLLNVQAHVVSRTKLFSLHDFHLDISLQGLGIWRAQVGFIMLLCLHTWHRKDSLNLLAEVYRPVIKGYWHLFHSLYQVILSFWGQQYKFNAVCSQPQHTMDRDAVYLE